MPTTLERVTAIISEYLGVKQDSIGARTNLIDDLGCDSLDEVEIVLELESEFDIRIPDETPRATVGDIVRYIDSVRTK